jgi:mitogen-activated protein kinase 1/3
LLVDNLKEQKTEKKIMSATTQQQQISASQLPSTKPSSSIPSTTQASMVSIPHNYTSTSSSHLTNDMLNQNSHLNNNINNNTTVSHQQQLHTTNSSTNNVNNINPNTTNVNPAASSSSTSTTTTTTATFPQPPANAIPNSIPIVTANAPLETVARSKYKTFILSNGVFEVEQRYEIREIIGQGAYGIVCSALDLKTQHLVAIKKIENVFGHRSLAKRTLRELKLCRSFTHENILGLERVMRPHSANFSNIYLVSELMETDLACVIRSPQELTDEHCQFFIYQVLRGLKYIHSANVIHRDLKPRNLLVNSNCDLKICDFGLARVDDPDNNDRAMMSSYIATRWYRAPEVILGRKKYTKAVDMWSVGCILAELIGRKPIFPGRDSFHQITLIVSILGTPQPSASQMTGDRKKSSGPNDDYVSNLPKKPKVPFRTLYSRASPLACDLLDKLLVFEPEKRLTVEEALRHPYLEELHCEEDEPVCENFEPSDFFFEFVRTTKDDLRVLIHQEIVNHYKEETFESNRSAFDSFSSQMLKSLPKGRKSRRKSF